MGTIGVQILQSVLDQGHELLAVYTRGGKKSGRGLKIKKNAIHEFADDNHISVFCPDTLRNEEQEKLLKSLNPDVVLVYSYGLIIPGNLLKIPKFGFVNIHPSDLPRWRGPSPIESAVMAGDKKMAVCIMQMDEGLDTGDVILRKKFDIGNEFTASELHKKVIDIARGMVLDTLSLFKNRSVSYQKQSDEGVTYSKKFLQKDRLIDFNLSAEKINCMIRAFSPKPGAYFYYKDEIIKVIKADVVPIAINEARPGTVLDKFLTIACKDSAIRPLLLQRQGRKMIYTEAFLRGYAIAVGDVVCGL